MKVKIGNYPAWFGPYQMADFLCFWAKEVKDEHGFSRPPDWVHKFGELLAHGSIEPETKVGEKTSFSSDARHHTVLAKFLSWIHTKQKRTVRVRIDHCDTWSMDHTLSYVVLPMLEHLKEHQQGACLVDDSDVPIELQSTSAPPKENEWDIDDNHFDRWDWVLDEMIFAFRAKQEDDWEDQFYSGEHDTYWKKLESGNSEWVKGPNDTFTIDKVGRDAFQARITNGFRLFGRYYENLWN